MRFVDRLFCGTDGNFKLTRKRKVGDADDTSLVGDRGYFVDETEYNEYQSAVEAAKGESFDKPVGHKFAHVQFEYSAKHSRKRAVGFVLEICISRRKRLV